MLESSGVPAVAAAAPYLVTRDHEHQLKARLNLLIDAVAAELGISTNAVFIAKSRVLKRLRTEIEGLID